MPKSALPIGTTPHRRKKAPTKNSSADYVGFSIGDGAAADSTRQRGGSDASKTSTKSNVRAKSPPSHTEKENTLNGSTKSRHKSDDSLDKLNNSMAKISLNSTASDQNKHLPFVVMKHELRDTDLPTHAFPTIKYKQINRPLLESVKRLKDVDTKQLTTHLTETIQEASLKPTASMSLEENCSTIKQVIKQCLKSPSFDSLRVAIHSLRSITGMIGKGTGVKLGFHCCLLSGEAMMKCLDAAANSNSKSDNKWREVAEYGMLTVAAYQYLGRLINGGKFSWDSILLTDTKKELLPKRQMVKICLDSGIAACSALMHMTLLSMRGELIEDEFAMDLACDFQVLLTKAVIPLLLDTEEDGIKFAKRIFRFLWDGARCADDSRVALHLQYLSVSVLARYCIGAFASSDADQRKELHSLWDRSASSALKAVVAFEKQGTDKKMRNALIEFHEVTGAILDNIWIQFTNIGERMLPPPSYFEYCTYKCVHQWKFLGLVNSIHSPESLLRDKACNYTKGDMESLAAMAVLSLSLLTLKAHAALVDDQNDSISHVDTIISNFDAIIRNVSSTSQTRCRSMTRLLNLQRDATKLISSHWSSPHKHGHASAALGYVLGWCMAALETRLSKATQEEQQTLNLRLSASDNHAKAASFLDLSLEDPGIPSDTAKKWNSECVRQIRKGYEILSVILQGMDDIESDTPVVLAVEMFAKTAASISKNLSNRKNTASSIELQIYASDLLTRLASIRSNHTSFDKYQISTRYMLLSSAFETNGNTKELCASLALGVWSAAKRNHFYLSIDGDDDDSFIGDTTSEELLLFPASSSVDVQSNSETSMVTDGLAITINKLARACIEVTASQSVTSIDIPKGTTVAKVLEAAIDEEKKFSISRLLDHSVWGSGSFTLTESLELSREILKCSSKVLKSYISNSSMSDQDGFFSILNELSDFLCLQKERMKDLMPPDDLQVISSAMHVSLGMNLVDSQLLRSPKQKIRLDGKDLSGIQSTIVGFSIDQLNQAEMLFQFHDSSEQSQDACFFVQWAAVLLYQTILSEYNEQSSTCASMQQYERVLDICRQAIHQLNSVDEDTPQVTESLIATMKKLLCRFSLHGDPLLTSQCFVHLQKFYALDNREHMFDSVSDFLWISSKFDDLAAVLYRHCMFQSNDHCKSLLGEEVNQLDQDEQLSVVSNCIVNLMVTTSQQLSGNFMSQAGMEPHLQGIAEFIATTESEWNNDDNTDFNETLAKCETFIRIQSFVITILMLRAKLFLNAKRPESSVRCLDLCRAECKQMISFIRSASRYVNDSDDKLLQVDDLLSIGLERISIAFSSLGNRRKAEDNAILAAMKQNLVSIECSNMNKITFNELIQYAESLDGMYNCLPSLRTIISVKSMSLPPDKLSSESTLFDNIQTSNNPDTSLINGINRSRLLLTYNDSFREAPNFKNKCDVFLSLAHTSIIGLMDLAATEESAEVPLSPLIHPTEQEVKFRMITSEHRKSGVTDLLEEIVAGNTGTIPNFLADAYLELGLESLQRARSNNELHQIWKDHNISFSDTELGGAMGSGEVKLSHALEARKYLNCALLHAHPASSFTTKKILRCLALVTGPGALSSYLTHSSVGGAARNTVRDAITDSKLHRIFNLFDDETSNIETRTHEFNDLLSEYSSLIPPNWSISSIAICPTRDILITSFRVSDQGEPIIKTVCKIANDGTKLNHSNIHDTVLFPLDKIIERSQKQLRGIDETEQSSKYNDESSKRKWWNERHLIDDDLRSLLQHTEDEYFGSDIVRQMLIPPSADDCQSDDDGSECSDISPGNLAERFEAAERESVVKFDEETERLALKKLTVIKLKEKLDSFGIDASKVQKMRKADLIDQVIIEMEKDFTKKTAPEAFSIQMDDHNAIFSSGNSNLSHNPSEPCSILLLDENLHRLPFESMDMFSNTAVTRLPSLPFVIAALHERKSAGSNPSINPSKVNYIIDPERNLRETASKMEPALNLIASRNEWEWRGCIGEMPTPEFMRDSLTQENSLLIYCGHGGGEKFFKSSQVEELIESEDDPERRGCFSAIILMGCSSGKLKSVNCPKDNPDDLVYPIYYEPEGVTLSYILAGAPCVVGNLWDVTDRDIDRYCLTLLDDFFSNDYSSAPSLAKCVSLARRACKLRYIVGSAPVCYGLPVHMLR